MHASAKPAPGARSDLSLRAHFRSGALSRPRSLRQAPLDGLLAMTTRGSKGTAPL